LGLSRSWGVQLDEIQGQGLGEGGAEKQFEIE